jgi:hypothetical protein
VMTVGTVYDASKVKGFHVFSTKYLRLWRNW